jgi:hypothetical protein
MLNPRWFEWAEKGADPNRTFSPVVVGRFFVAMFATGAVAVAIKMAIYHSAQAREEAARQEEMNRQVQQMLESGEAGETMERLFNYKRPVKQQPAAPKGAPHGSVEISNELEQLLNKPAPAETDPASK